MAANYKGPPIFFEDHYNSTDAQQAWVEMKRAEHWVHGGDCVQYGHTKTSEPLVRMKYAGRKGVSAWFPLFRAAKNWNKQYDQAMRKHKNLVSKA